MNQILYEDTGDKRPVDTKKIVMFFGIAIIIFGLILGAIGIIQIMKSKTPVSRDPATIMVDKFNSSLLKLSIIHDKSISKITYDWNGTNERTIDTANRKNIETTIELPVGENILNITVVDEIGVEATFTGLYSDGTDFAGPVIKLSQIDDEGTKKINIHAEDDTEIAYLTYRWNNDTETRVEATDTSNTIIETNIDIPTDLPAGDNKLTVVAVDGNNNESREVQEIKIARRPIIEFPRQNRDKMYIKVTDDVGLEYVQYVINGESYTWKSATGEDKVCETFIPLQPGENLIDIHARNINGIEAKSFYGKCIYTVDE